ncbi:Hypothetical predicted protein [Lecanosticta acicola]|uniref:Uncharacterized protein n=1 Tax=Lecanosticta acicola TaxID=111012 RepID=A0AAI8YVG0_9PEZI|nr:Hypothetical predicted protein [Lecanosticta acicola]
MALTQPDTMRRLQIWYMRPHLLPNGAAQKLSYPLVSGSPRNRLSVSASFIRNPGPNDTLVVAHKPSHEGLIEVSKTRFRFLPVAPVVDEPKRSAEDTVDASVRFLS